MKCYLPFTEGQFRSANEEWGCNCGPSALAFALQTSLAFVRNKITKFESRRYTSPNMMRGALFSIGRKFDAIRSPTPDDMFSHRISLVRIQWTGPWTNPTPKRWASKHTHWITTWQDGAKHMLFDCNGGPSDYETWEEKIVPLLMASTKNCDGWRPANVWRLEELPKRPRSPIDAMVDKACGIN